MNPKKTIDQNDHYWEVKRDGQVLAHGPEETMPTSAMCKDMKLGGLKVYVLGKVYREEKKC